jgi:Flp pilus assembly protein TadD
LNAAIGKEPDLERAYFYRGQIYFGTGDSAKAIAGLTKAIQLDPKDAQALYERGVVKTKNGDAAGGDADIAAASQ